MLATTFPSLFSKLSQLSTTTMSPLSDWLRAEELRSHISFLAGSRTTTKPDSAPFCLPANFLVLFPLDIVLCPSIMRCEIVVNTNSWATRLITKATASIAFGWYSSVIWFDTRRRSTNGSSVYGISLHSWALCDLLFTMITSWFQCGDANIFIFPFKIF